MLPCEDSWSQPGDSKRARRITRILCALLSFASIPAIFLFWPLDYAALPISIIVLELFVFVIVGFKNQCLLKFTMILSFLHFLLVSASLNVIFVAFNIFFPIGYIYGKEYGFAAVLLVSLAIELVFVLFGLVHLTRCVYLLFIWRWNVLEERQKNAKEQVQLNTPRRSF